MLVLPAITAMAHAAAAVGHACVGGFDVGMNCADRGCGVIAWSNQPRADDRQWLHMHNRTAGPSQAVQVQAAASSACGWSVVNSRALPVDAACDCNLAHSAICKGQWGPEASGGVLGGSGWWQGTPLFLALQSITADAGKHTVLQTWYTLLQTWCCSSLFSRPPGMLKLLSCCMFPGFGAAPCKPFHVGLLAQCFARLRPEQSWVGGCDHFHAMNMNVPQACEGTAADPHGCLQQLQPRGSLFPEGVLRTHTLTHLHTRTHTFRNP